MDALTIDRLKIGRLPLGDGTPALKDLQKAADKHDADVTKLAELCRQPLGDFPDLESATLADDLEAATGGVTREIVSRLQQAHDLAKQRDSVLRQILDHLQTRAEETSKEAVRTRSKVEKILDGLGWSESHCTWPPGPDTPSGHSARYNNMLRNVPIVREADRANGTAAGAADAISHLASRGDRLATEILGELRKYAHARVGAA